MTEQVDERFPVTEWDFDELRLRLYRDDDAEAVMAACSDPVTRRFLPGLPDPYTRDDALTYIRVAATDAWKQGRAQWAIAEADSDKVVGSLGVPRTHPVFDTVEIGYIVAPWARGRGIAGRATAQVAEFLLNQGVARVELQVAAGNLASQHAALRAGFTCDGKVRQGTADRDGARVDKWLFGRVAGDPPGPVARAIPELPGGELSDGVVTLRRLDAADFEDHFKHRDTEDVWRRSVPPVPPDREFTLRFCEYGAAEQWLHGVGAFMSVRDARTDAYLGDFGVHVQMGPPGEVMLSYGLGPQARGRGLATRAVRLASRWAISELKAARVMAGTAADNTASQAVLERAGFTREGVQRALLPGVNDTRVDNVCWSLLPEEF